MKKFIIKCKTDQTYLSPFVYGEHWVSDINKAYIFKENRKIKEINDLCVDIFLDKDNLILFEKTENGLFEYDFKESEKYFFDYESFLKIKINFNLCNDKTLIHYLIYAIIKKKDPFKVFILGHRKFKYSFSRLVEIIKFLENFEENENEIMRPFINIKKEKIEIIIKRLIKELNG